MRDILCVKVGIIYECFCTTDSVTNHECERLNTRSVVFSQYGDARLYRKTRALQHFYFPADKMVLSNVWTAREMFTHCSTQCWMTASRMGH